MGKIPTSKECSVMRTIDILGDRWTASILREAFFGVKHFDGFCANLGISTNILTDRLKNLVEHGIMQRRKETRDARRVTYRLTEKGRDLYPIILAFLRWGDRWLAGEQGPPLTLYHNTCGNRILPQMCCAACKAEILAGDVSYKKNESKENQSD